MKIIEPKVELWQQGNNAKAHIARCVYTYSIDEWRAIIDLRYYGTTG